MRRGTVDSKIGAGAEGPLTGGGEDDGSDRDISVGVIKQVDDPVPLVGSERVAGVGPVQHDPRDAVAHIVTNLIFQRSVISHRPERIDHAGGAPTPPTPANPSDGRRSPPAP